MVTRGLCVLVFCLVGFCLVEGRRWPRIWRLPNVCHTQIRTNCTIRSVEIYPCDEQRESPTSSGQEDHTKPEQEGQTSSPTRSKRGQRWSRAMCFRGYRRPRFRIRWCLRTVVEVVPCITTFRHCCEGWTQGLRGLCNKRVQKDSKCTRGCENGGKCKEKTGTCKCKRGFEGDRCEKAVCTPSCENGGACTSVEGKPKCNCPKAFKGKRCQIAVCTKGCLNGGLCSAVGTQARCTCKPGYAGERCEMLEREGECPLPPLPRHVVLDHRNCGGCTYDANCPGKQKCCDSDCGLVCMDPAPTTCVYNGTVEIEIGSSFEPDPCTLCTCLEPDLTALNGGATCTTMTCPPVDQRCRHQTREDNQCCATCVEGNARPQNYTAPRFIDCPEDVVVIDLPRKGRTVDLKPGLQAVNMYSNPLEVRYSKENLTWHEDLERNFYLVRATATDQWNEMVNCLFMVRVRDPHPPTFEKCPTDINVETDVEIVTWEPPQASDNTDRPVTSRSDFSSGQTFSVGETIVTYTAEDAEGNVDLCQFFVSVSVTAKFTGGEDTPPPVITPVSDNLSGDDDDDEEGAYQKYCYIGGAAGLIVLLVAAIILFWFCKRRRAVVIKKIDSPDTFDYPVESDLPPTYASVVKPTGMSRSEMATKTSFDNVVYMTSESVTYNRQNDDNHRVDE